MTGEVIEKQTQGDQPIGAAAREAQLKSYSVTEAMPHTSTSLDTFAIEAAAERDKSISGRLRSFIQGESQVAAAESAQIEKSNREVEARGLNPNSPGEGYFATDEEIAKVEGNADRYHQLIDSHVREAEEQELFNDKKTALRAKELKYIEEIAKDIDYDKVIERSERHTNQIEGAIEGITDRAQQASVETDSEGDKVA